MEEEAPVNYFIKMEIQLFPEDFFYASNCPGPNVTKLTEFTTVKPSNPKFVALKLVATGRKAIKVMLCQGFNVIKLNTAVIY